MSSLGNIDLPTNPELRRVSRQIAAVVGISADGKFLLGKKFAHKGGSYADYWHLPGGGVEENETLIEAAIREAKEEVGLELDPVQLIPVQDIGYGEIEKSLPSGERVIVEMRFNRFEVRLPQNADNVSLPTQTEEFEQLRWFSPLELKDINQIPGGKEFFISQGYMSS